MCQNGAPRGAKMTTNMKKCMPKIMPKFGVEKNRRIKRLRVPLVGFFERLGERGLAEFRLKSRLISKVVSHAMHPRQGCGGCFLVKKPTLGTQGSVDYAILVDFGRFEKSSFFRCLLGTPKNRQNAPLERQGVAM